MWLVQEILVRCREIILGTRMTAEGLAVAELLEVVEPARDAAIAVRVVGIKRDGRAAVDAAVDLFRVDDVLELAVDDARLLGAVRVDEIAASVGRVVGTLGIAVAQRRLERRERGDGAGVALELASALVVRSLDSGFAACKVFLSSFGMMRLTEYFGVLPLMLLGWKTLT